MGYKLGYNIEMIIVSILFVIIFKVYNFFFIFMYRIIWVDLLKEGMKRNVLLKLKCYVLDIFFYKDRDDFLMKKIVEIC